MARLEVFASVLEDWNARISLVSAASMKYLWRRHIWDSAQLFRFIPEGVRSLVDLGSGAGFPGLILAVLLGAHHPIRVVLYESIAKKCRFLEEVAYRTGVEVEVRNARIEEAGPEPFDIVTARACAPLTQLLAYALPFQDKDSRSLFLKGQGVGAELTEAYKDWSMVVEQRQSLSDPSGTILEIRELHHRV